MARNTNLTRVAACLAVALSVGCGEGKVGTGDSADRSGDGSDDAVGGGTRGTGVAQGGKRVSCPENAPQPINRVRIYPAAGKAAALRGVRIQGSNTSPTNDFVDLTTVSASPREGQFTELKFENDLLYRYVKLYAPDPNTGAIAELELYSGDVRIEGKPFGTAASSASAGGFALALDGDTKTAFDGSPAGGSYVGLDVAGDAVAATPTFTPPPGNFEQAPEVEIVSSTRGATIRYTTDGSNPSRDNGVVYEGAVKPEGRASIKAVAYADCLFASAVASGGYGVGGEKIVGGLSSYHLGNSLTDTIQPWLKPIADSTGVEHRYARWTIPGAPIKWINEHRGQGFGDPVDLGAQNIETFVPKFAPIDHFSLQPYDVSINNEGPAALELLKPVLASSPNVQVWIYAQWPPRDMPGKVDNWKGSALAVGATWSDPPYVAPKQPTNWEEATLSQEDFHRTMAAWVDERIPGKPVKVMPGGRALVLLKRAIEAGQVPGTSDFFNEAFGDDLHLSAKGQYLVSLVFYANMYQQSPEGRVTHEGTGLSEPQARVYQRLAWEAVNQQP